MFVSCFQRIVVHRIHNYMLSFWHIFQPCLYVCLRKSLRVFLKQMGIITTGYESNSYISGCTNAALSPSSRLDESRLFWYGELTIKCRLYCDEVLGGSNMHRWWSIRTYRRSWFDEAQNNNLSNEHEIWYFHFIGKKWNGKKRRKLHCIDIVHPHWFINLNFLKPISDGY